MRGSPAEIRMPSYRVTRSVAWELKTKGRVRRGPGEYTKERPMILR